MSYGTETNFVIYPEQFFGGMVETLQQNAEAFNDASGNSVRLFARPMLGDYEKESFIKSTSGLINHRSPTNASAVADNNLAQLDITSVKVNKRIGPVAETLDAFKKIAVDPMEFSLILGQQVGAGLAIQFLNSGLAAVRAAIASQGATLQYNNTGQTIPTATHTALVSGMQLFGDRAERIKAWVMHSATYFELMKQSIADKVFQVASATIYQGTVATLGKPVIISDSPMLLNGSTASNATQYDILGLVEDAVQVIESEDRNIVSQLVTGQDNLVMRIQGELAYNVKVAGTTYSLTNGGLNPTDYVLSQPGNWQFQMADPKLAPGVRITTL